MFFENSPCDPNGGAIIFSYADLQKYGDESSTVLGFPIGPGEGGYDDSLSQTSIDNSTDLLVASFGDMSLTDLVECFDVLCSPQLDSAQSNLSTLQNVLGDNSLSQEEISVSYTHLTLPTKRIV